MASSPEFVLLLDLGLAVVAALGFSYVFSRLHQPVVVGHLLAGMIIGPFGLGLIEDLNTINLLASLGVVLLLFTVGLELDPLEIRRIGAEGILLAIVELIITFGCVLGGSLALGLTYLESTFVALAVATTSTAIMGKILLETKRLKARESHFVMTASVAEDFATVLILLLLPGLVVATSQVTLTDMVFLTVKGLLLVSSIFLVGWKLVPRVIDRVGMEKEEYRETAFLLALSFGFAFALLSSYLGFSPAIGAFLVGLMIRGPHASLIADKVGPVKDLFIILFFVSMGALINLGALLTMTLPIVVIVATAIGGKFIGAWAGAKLTSARNYATSAGISMLPRGEFSFIIAREGTLLGVARQLLFPAAGLSTLIGTILASLGLRLVRPAPVVAPLSTPASTAIKELG